MSGASALIIGGGVEGLAVARALGARGLGGVLVVERDVIGAGFTGKSSGIIRCHYGSPSLAAMAWRSLPVLEDADRALGDIGFHRTGYLVGVGPENAVALKANVAMQQAIGIDVSLISPGEAGAMLPAMQVDDFDLFAYEPRGGYADAYQTAAAFAQQARGLGAEVRQGCEIAHLTAAGSRVSGAVTTTGERIEATAVVVAAGPWSTGLVSDLGVVLPIKTQREQMMIVDPGQPLGDVPVMSDLVTLQYLRAERSDLLLGNSDHCKPEWSDPDGYENTLDDDYLGTAIDKFMHRFPSLTGASLSSSYAGCYDVTPDYNPVIGPTLVDGLFVCAGFSGHGYKISPAVGELVADLLIDGASRDPLIDGNDFRLSRFDEGCPLVSQNPYAGAPEMR